MFLGQHFHSLDAKGRIILPARFRDQLALACITSQVDGCLAIWSSAEFEARARHMSEKFDGDGPDRDSARVFFSGAEMATPDAQGRIAIPAHLRSFAGLEKDVVVNGAYDHLEVWDSRAWEVHKEAGERALGGSGGSSSGGTTNGERR